MKYRLLLLVLSITLLFSCSNTSKDIPDDAVISYLGEYVSLADLEYLQAKETTKVDSALWLEDFKKQWLRNQIIIEKAEKDLPSSALNIEQELLQYKADLLMFRYENHYLKNKINKQVSALEAKEFYESNKSTLISDRTLVKAVYIEIPNTISDRYKVKYWLSSKKEKDQENLKNYCFKYAKVFDDFEDNWIELSSLVLMSKSQKIFKGSLKTGKVLEHVSKDNTHFIILGDIVQKGKLMPFEYAKSKIVNVIINKRKKILLKEFSSKIENELEAQLK